MNCRFASIIVLFAGLLTGCAAAPPSHYYELSVPGEAAPVPQGATYPLTLLLGPLRASHLYREDEIVYSGKGDQMGTYEYHRWVEPPTEMLEDIFLRDLRTSGRYRAVYLLRSNSRGDYILYGRLYDFKEVSGPPLMTRVTFDVELREAKTGSIVWTHYYTNDEPAAGKDISDVIAALDRNAQRGAQDIKAGLDQYFSTHPINSSSIQ